MRSAASSCSTFSGGKGAELHVTVCINKLDDVTGTETYCLDLLAELAAHGHDASVFTLTSAPQTAARVASTGAELYTYPVYPMQAPDRAIVMHPLATTLLLRRIDQQVPTLAIIHSPWPDEYPVRLPRIDRFIAVSPYIADLLQTRHGLRREDVGVIPNGIDTSYFDAPSLGDLRGQVRVLWGSVYHPDRHDALVSVIDSVLARDDLRLTVVDAHLPQGLVPAHERIELVSKHPDTRELLRNAEVVCALGPGRILLEALAMNRAALCLNTHRQGEYVDASNLVRLEYYFAKWGRPIDELLAAERVNANANRRDVAITHFDAKTNFSALIGELEQLEKRPRAPLSYRLADVKRLPYLARAYGVLVESQPEPHRAWPPAATAARWAFRGSKLLPASLRRALHRLAR